MTDRISPVSSRSLPRLTAGCVALALAAGCMTGADPGTDVAASGLTQNSLTADLSFSSDWGGGYCANVTITNGGAPTTSWTVVINMNQSVLANAWGAGATAARGQLTASSLSYNGALATNGSASFGFCGNATGSSYRPAVASVSATRATTSGGSGGITATGGTTGSGGARATGGTTGTGGSAATGGTVGSSGSPATGSGSTCAQYGNIWMNGNLYYAQNDVWGSSLSQCISVSGTALSVTSANFNNGTSGSPASYPSFVFGCAYGNCTSNSGLPKAIGAISSAPSSFSVTSAGGAWDLAYDIWLDPTARTNGQNTGEEIMIWLDSAGAQPAGSQVGTASIDGQTWEVWFTRMSQWNYVAYRAHGLRSVNIDVKHFINDSIQRGYAQSSWYLTAIEAGFEIWQGGTGLKINSFSAKVN
jgi:hypothetical protein